MLDMKEDCLAELLVFWLRTLYLGVLSKLMTFRLLSVAFVFLLCPVTILLLVFCFLFFSHALCSLLLE